MLWAVVIAFLMSGIGSYFLLNRPREALARGSTSARSG